MWENEVGDEGAFKKIDVAELESMFAASGAPQKKEEEDDGGDRDSGAGPKKPAKPTIVTLVDPKTANNVGIAISRFKKSEAEIASAITDGSETAFTSDQLSSLLAILPSAEDVETVKGYDGDVAMLGKTEQFFLAIAGVPRFQIRTRCMLIRATFPEKEAELKEKLKAVSAAADEVRTSMCLKVVLEYTLALGNYLNGTSNKGAAWGFKLETLNKLQGTKSTDNKTTLLHYLARLYEAEAAKASDPETFSLSATMPNLEMAARTVWKDDGAELAQLTAALKQVETQVKVDKVAAFTSSMGRFQTAAKEKEMALTEMKTKTDANLKELKKWFGEPEKTEPEEVFSTLHNFVLMFEKARKYNKEMDALEKKQKMRDAAKAAGGVAAFAGAADGGGGRLKVNRPGPAQMGVNSELAAALGKRNKNLVDGAVDGMANGTLLNARRQASFSRRGADKKAAANAAGGGTSKI